MPARRTTKQAITRTILPVPGPATFWPWAQVWLLWLETGWAAPQVIAHRTRRMLRSGPFPGAADRDEFRRMFDEKIEAWFESQLRLSAELWKQWFVIAGSAMRPWWLAPTGASHAARWRSAWGGAARRWMRSAPRIARIGLGPVHRRVTANARRLGAPRS